MPQSHNLRTISMPVAMMIGALFCNRITALENWTGNMIAPMMIFLMLFITCCRVDIRRMRLTWLHFWLLLIQLGGSIAVWYAVSPLDTVIAQGAMICVLAPIAMAAVVIGGILGANIETMAIYTLVCHLVTAFVAPFILHLAGGGDCTLAAILAKVAPLLVLPFVCGQLCREVFKPVGRWVVAHNYLSFYVWLVSLVVIIGRTTSFIIDHGETEIDKEIIMAVVSLTICLCQFGVGKWLGRKYGDVAAGGQMLGQKNTVLAVWMAQSFLNPLSSVAPTAYIVWQNFVNSWQMYRSEHPKKSRK